jgi:hypothetical protein
VIQINAAQGLPGNEEVNLLLGVIIYVKFYASHCKKIKRLIG